ncbi:MauE/DoxX family redox-associated membrane protein [Actinospica robiniae]|uniref:MauE/DoxX family redox-associated membrane protein n=1 Tax=Actinospica robiniae TaxID=304901 RepID=UPI000688EA87|nr:MauE/DoxX family redox-associated membrane protein [Actinospica robiniae]
MSLFALCLRLALAGVFGASALGKVRTLRSFADALRGFAPVSVPRWAARTLAVLLAVVEFCVAVGLLVPRTARPALVATEVLLGVFILVIVRASRSRVQATCACFGSDGRRPLGALHLWRDLALAAAGVVPLVQSPATGSFARFAFACLPAVVVTVLVVRLEDLAALFDAPDPAAPGAPRGASYLEPRT